MVAWLQYFRRSLAGNRSCSILCTISYALVVYHELISIQIYDGHTKFLNNLFSSSPNTTGFGLTTSSLAGDGEEAVLSALIQFFDYALTSLIELSAWNLFTAALVNDLAVQSRFVVAMHNALIQDHDLPTPLGLRYDINAAYASATGIGRLVFCILFCP